MGNADKSLPGKLTTSNELWFDAAIRHQIGMLRFAGGVRNGVWELLDATERDLRRAIVDRLAAHTGSSTPANIRRLQRLLAEIREIRTTAWRDVGDLWRSEMTALALIEPRFVSNLIETVVPVQLSTTLPTPAQLKALVRTHPFEGFTLSEWTRRISATDVQRIEGQIRIGLVQGEGPTQIAKRIVGTSLFQGTNGVTAITRRDAESITLTAANSFANAARREFFKQNSELFDVELFIATLDSKTTPICRANDGEQFDIGEGPIPPLHMRCRSLRVALLDAEALGERPMKPVTEKMLLREFSERMRFDRVAASRDGLPFGTKTAFDDFARRRTRELVGRVPAKVTYSEFLRRQSVEFQRDVLGQERYLLFRNGQLTLKTFVDPNTGRQYTLAQLARMHADAFRAAGLDPAEFAA